MEGGGVVVKGRVTIDTRPPFRSVKEAVSLFGEKVLAGEIYGRKLEQAPTIGTGKSRDLKPELEETKRRLDRSREEEKAMANTLALLRQELERKRRELQDLKCRKLDDCFCYGEPEMEEIKFVASNRGEGEFEARRRVENPTPKKFVSFASPPATVRETEGVPEKGRVSKEGKKKGLGIGWIFSSKKRNL